MKESNIMKGFSNGVYLITDRHQTKERPLLAVVEEALKAGAEAVQSSEVGAGTYGNTPLQNNPIALQLREKDLSARELLELARRMRQLTNQYGARFFINDRLDIALAVEADGVHLGQKSFSPENVREILNSSHPAVHDSRLLIGVSTHSLKEAKKAEEDGADFITIGPIFYTPSKTQYGEPLGVDIVKRVKAEIEKPVFAIGGIKKENIRAVMRAGADGVAVISAIMGAEAPAMAVKEFMNRVRESKGQRVRAKTLTP